MSEKPKIGWEHAITFEEWVIRMYENKKVLSEEFQKAHEFHGDRIDKIIAAYEKRKNEKLS